MRQNILGFAFDLLELGIVTFINLCSWSIFMKIEEIGSIEKGMITFTRCNVSSIFIPKNFL